LRRYRQDEEGASAAEYALILAIVGAMLAGSMLFLGGTIGNSINHSGAVLASAGSPANPADPGGQNGATGGSHAGGNGNTNASGNGNGNGGVGNGNGKGNAKH
jgi:pilus assembly protein Flp/PilA